VNGLIAELFAYLSFSLVGYFSIYKREGGIPDLIINHDTSEIFLQIAMIMMTLAVFVGFALNMHPCRIEIYNLFKTDYIKDFSWPIHLVLTGALVVLGGFITMFYAEILNVLGFVGGTMGNFIFLVFPGLFPI